MTRDITAFRRVGDLYRRTREIHHLISIEPHLVSDTLTSVGFRVSIQGDYAGHNAPQGLCIFHAHKPHDATA